MGTELLRDPPLAGPFPPFFLVALRFALLAVPTVLLVRRPTVPWRWILGYGAGFGVLQFLFLYLAMASGMPSGLASLVLQSSAPFTVVLAGVLLRERLSGRQALGVATAAAGLAGIAVHRAELGGGAMLLPFLLTVCGGLGWALGNLCSRQARATEPFRLTLWMTVVPPLPMLVAHWPSKVRLASRRRWPRWAPGRAPWPWPAPPTPCWSPRSAGRACRPGSRAATRRAWSPPYSMLVPVAGMASSSLVLGEPTFAVELVCGAVVVAGVLLGSGPAAPVQRAAGRSAVEIAPRVPTAPLPAQAAGR
ncbi:EamA family transporter [Blastococcus sp. VKM Ac-2987]|uniref:EamA family transporter n=1 Tax=Blastococcus sp. VKM Ac-2987 TaxID=3004141 RepID=UPI0022ABAB0C|nr:EamA family transporter [Blastococcus sp. VKM Ac-2987]MCZ2860822.1 EamA family transporter [Blastococcus sp. VKM Ac-2987]